jgi:hypothetical protein
MKKKKNWTHLFRGGTLYGDATIMGGLRRVSKISLDLSEVTTMNQEGTYYLENIFRGPVAFMKGVIKIFLIL